MAESSFHHCGAKTQKSCDFDDRLLLSGTQHPVELVEQSDQHLEVGSSIDRLVGQCTIVLNMIQAATSELLQELWGVVDLPVCCQ